MKNLIIRSTQYPNPLESDLINLWQQDIESIYNLWVQVFTDNKFYLDVIEGIEKTHGPDKDKFYFVFTSYHYFIQYICLEIRRTADVDSRTISIMGILSSMYVHNQLFPLERGLKNLNSQDNDYLKNEYVDLWKEFADEKNNYLSQKKILELINDLISVVDPVKIYVDKKLAHNEKDANVNLTYQQLWDSANYILRLIDKLKLLLNFSSGSFDAIPQYDKYNHLYKAFWNDNFKPNRDEEERFRHPGKIDN